MNKIVIIIASCLLCNLVGFRVLTAYLNNNDFETSSISIVEDLDFEIFTEKNNPESKNSSFHHTNVFTINSSNFSNCEFKGIPLHGKVKFVDNFPDIKIQYVDHFPDINVKFVSNFPDDCGEWQVVESFEDFSVQVVEHFPDIKVKVVEHFPGME